MISNRKSHIKAARTITRGAELDIKKKTGMSLNLLACTNYHLARTPDKMMLIIAACLGMDPAAFTLKSRERNVVELRFLTAYFLRSYFPTITLQQISVLFGGQDHTSIMNGLARTNMLLQTNDLRFMEKYETVLKSVNQWLRKDTSVYASAICA